MIMDNIFAKIDEYTEAFKNLKIWALVKAVLVALQKGMDFLGEDEVAGIFGQISEFDAG